MKRRNVLGMIGALGASVIGLAGHGSAEADDEPQQKRRAGRVTRFYRPLGASLVLARDATEVQVVDTTDETDLLSYTIPAGALGTDSAVRLMLAGTHKNNSGGSVDFRIRIKLGATTLFDDIFTRSDDAADYPSHLDLTVAQVAVNTQFAYGAMTFASATGPTAGRGDLASAPGGGPIQGDAAEDEATDLTLAVTVEMDTADPDANFTKYYATLELL